MSDGDDDAASGIVLNMRLYEDVAAELEELILYSRLGVVDDAAEILDTVLWRHLQFFPVVAEAALFLVHQRDYGRLLSLLGELQDRSIHFVHAEEVFFIEILKLIVPGGTHSTTTTQRHVIKTIFPPMSIDSAAQARSDQLATTFDEVLEYIDYQKPIQVQTAEILFVEKHVDRNEIAQFISLAESHRRKLTTNKLDGTTSDRVI
ncbi:hypothetical protein H2198_003022 [Neophaeococcomyces mojaviensis]|uniref:Uncharacterized protein n=1 Tax=Neophaeococcomyces mojaviensis TaxID=3383035 RepID=A0ACC3ACI3_9EURO|nr:hypothetical protein H2198_003022 [Knufia sp. JES_112]